MVVQKGRASCLGCRKRRIKCDQVKPHCSQCLRAGMQCKGYRVENGLMFVDQTERTVTAHTSRHVPHESRSRTIISGQGHPSNTVEQVKFDKVSLLPAWNFGLDMDSAAQRFFSIYYAIGSSSPEHIMTAKVAESMRPGCVAVGLAGLARVIRAPPMLVLARREYGRTLKELQSTLCNLSRETIQDMIALLSKMAMFEMIVCEDVSTSGNWINHIYGIAAVLNSATKKNPVATVIDEKNLTNFRGMLHVGLLMTVGACLRGLHAPEALNVINKSSLANSFGCLRTARGLLEISTRFISSPSTKHCERQSEPAKSSRMSTLLEFETDLVAWKMNLGEAWLWTIDPNEHNDVFGAQQHEYGGAWMASVWTYHRLFSILLYSALLKEDEITSVPEQHKGYEDKLAEQWADFRASMPYQLQLRNGSKRDKMTPFRYSGVFALVGSIQLLVKRVNISAQKTWLLETLSIINKDFGVGQALVLRDLIEKAV